MTIRTLTAIALLLAASACNRSPAAHNSTAPANTAVPAAAPAPAPQAPAPVNTTANTAAASENKMLTPPRRPEGCAGEIGVAEAQELANQCREVSPATRPPCNPSNSCEMIEAEINRGCEMLGEDMPDFCQN